MSGGGCFRTFQNGSIYWAPGLGAQVVLNGAVQSRWTAAGAESGPLGYPVTDTVCGLRDGGCFQLFQSGAVYSSASTGARFVRGEIRDLWARTGWEAGWLGYPTSDEICGLQRGGCVTYFQNGSIFWSPGTGARAVNVVLMGKWQSLGWEAGVVGYPLANVSCGLAGNGCYTMFELGSLYWSPATGTQVIRGPIRDLWAATGAESGWLGYPTTDEICGLAGGGCLSYF